MPPRSSLTSSFSLNDSSNNEVVCPLSNRDGSSCRKRCIGEKRYRSMQEHIRRAHPLHYISKLPATEESFLLMIKTAPQERPNGGQPSSSAAPGMFDQSPAVPCDADDGRPPAGLRDGSNSYYRDGASNPGTPRHGDEFTAGGGSIMGTARAAAALAQLHNVKSERDVNMDGVRDAPAGPPSTRGLGRSSPLQPHDVLTCGRRHLQGYTSDVDGRRLPRSSIELPPLNLPHKGITSAPYPPPGQRENLPSIMAESPPGRSSTLPPLQRSVGPNRPRKQSVTKRGREGHHKKKNSRGSAADWLRRIQNEDRMRLAVSDRKAASAEPSADYGKRWEDLIDAADQAASAAGDVDEDRTPVREHSHRLARARGSPRRRQRADGGVATQMPRSPISIHQASLPPLHHHHHQPGNYQASPLQQALTPPSYNQDGADPFPSVESGESGENFHMGPRGLSDSSPSFTSSQHIHIYCAACHGVSQLKGSYACTECICGLCSACVEILMAEQGARRKCPRCATIGGRFKPFQLEIR
ncbi:hypothetical protein DCS_01126 [Drechmeria coniospora]|uniref:RING zinc finger-like domain-containing protein n=1 Tax=Drechmeria coniospora TaxID=98403 RepID=A0A151GSJ7_DRECN|nr:hypothetical protein DCS_01126 [Drechmeria coniospora]KYK59992.1 hypothetical protein DCS_01126 [Drechmeria coniospora]